MKLILVLLASVAVCNGGYNPGNRGRTRTSPINTGPEPEVIEEEVKSESPTEPPPPPPPPKRIELPQRRPQSSFGQGTLLRPDVQRADEPQNGPRRESDFNLGQGFQGHRRPELHDRPSTIFNLGQGQRRPDYGFQAIDPPRFETSGGRRPEHQRDRGHFDHDEPMSFRGIEEGGSRYDENFQSNKNVGNRAYESHRPQEQGFDSRRLSMPQPQQGFTPGREEARRFGPGSARGDYFPDEGYDIYQAQLRHVPVTGSRAHLDQQSDHSYNRRQSY